MTARIAEHARLRRALAAAIALGALGLAASASRADRAPTTVRYGEARVDVEVTELPGSGRAYDFRVESGAQAAVHRRVAERDGQPVLRSSSALLDGLFALSLEELAADSVASIRDDAFNGGEPIDCACFETGARWHYVWTRDLSYAADLGLAFLDPERTRASLLFKTSGVRPALIAAGVPEALLIAQDTGSGGSWPVSSDRVVWIHAATGTIENLDGAVRAGFAAAVERIALDTLDQDREFAFDPAIGLYRGETSFLDWREQTYPGYTATDTRFIAESFALSTNVLHVVALEDAARLARQRGNPRAREFAAEAQALRAAINRWFWREDAGLYASYLAPTLTPLAVPAYDLLGLSLAVVHGVADARQARLIVRRYPATAAGPPVVFPEQPGVPIYHNRAIWPFVTAYAVRSARLAREPAIAARLIDSLVRGAAMALSNMENAEFLTGASAFEDGALSGPVINSPRQLWSVAAFAGLLVHTLAGVTPEREALAVKPFLPAALAEELGGREHRFTLAGVHHRGRVLDLSFRLPRRVPVGAWLGARSLTLNGKALRGTRFALASLKADGTNTLEVELGIAGVGAPAPPLLSVGDPHALTGEERAQLYAPATPPAPEGSRRAARVSLRLPAPEAGTSLALYRDGELLGEGLAVPEFEDRLEDGAATACYLLIARRTGSALASLPGPELCLADPAAGARVLPGDAAVEVLAAGGEPVTAAGELTDWGAPGERIRIAYTARAAGLQRFRIEYGNASGPVNTGITAAVKRVLVACTRSAAPQRSTLVMPHLPAGTSGRSSAVLFEAAAGERCVLMLSDGFNMSYLAHFGLYTGGAGGAGGPRNRATLKAFDFDYAGHVHARAVKAPLRRATLTQLAPSGGRAPVVGRSGAVA